MTVRRGVAAILAVLAVAIAGWLGLASRSWAAPAARGGLAVSLTALASELERGGPSASGELETLGGLNWLEGCVWDERRADAVLLGRAIPGLPELRTEDLVVALRNAWMVYAEQRGNTRTYSNPGCSIDPDPEVFARLQECSRKMREASTPAQTEEWKSLWKSTCQCPQQVRVLGIPFDTHFAQVMVDADYEMKTYVNGTAEVRLEAIPSLTALRLASARKAWAAGRGPASEMSFNRFWFAPGTVRYSVDTGIAELDACPIRLLTEEEYLAQGKLSGAGRAGELARQFTAAFTANFEDLASRRPLYRQLEGLFRLVAVAKLLRGKASSADWSYFLQRYPVPERPVSRTLPGLPSIAHWTQERTTPGGKETLQAWLPSCGGVGIDIELDRSRLERPADRRLEKMRQNVFASRPSAGSWSWAY